MQVMDIVNRAIMKSGVVSSFNPDEIPEDIQQRASDVLRHEIIPDLNCDRSVDITDTVMEFIPERCRVELRTTPLEYPRYIFGTSSLTSKELLSTEFDPYSERYYMKTLLDLLKDMGVITHTNYFDAVITEMWPQHQINGPRDVAIWSDDMKLIEISHDLNTLFDQEKPDFVNRYYNIPFNPAYIDEVYRACDGAPLSYVHHGEMVSAQYRSSQLVFTVEDDVTKIRIVLNKNCCANFPIQVVIPMPIKIINSYMEPHPWEGTIVAPIKFRSFLIATLAWRLASEYGVSTEDKMAQAAKLAYNNIIKNKTKREHPQDIERRINNYLRRNGGYGRSREGVGYSGGYRG